MASLFAVLFLGLVASAAPAPMRFDGTVLALLGLSDHDLISRESSQTLLQTTSKKSPQLVVLADEPVTGGNLTSAVEQSYLNSLPSSLKASQTLNNVTGIQVGFFEHPGDYDVRQIDISAPLMDTCRPKVSGIKALAEGIYCDSSQPSCSQTVKFVTTDTYQSSLGFSFSTTISAEADFVFAKASISSTYGMSYDYTWGRQDQFEKSYTFNLGPATYCTPSMVHIELECDLAAHSVYYDTGWGHHDYNGNEMWLEANGVASEHRSGGPYKNGQWCRYAHVAETILGQDQYWTPVSSQWPHRGEMWKQLPSALNQYKTVSSEPDITDDEVPIRRFPEYGNQNRDAKEIFVCKKFLGSEKGKTVRIPASQGQNALMGYIGCVR